MNRTLVVLLPSVLFSFLSFATLAARQGWAVCCECHLPASMTQCPEAAPVCFSNETQCLAHCPEFGCQGSIIADQSCAEIPSCEVIDPFTGAPALSHEGVGVVGVLLLSSGIWLARRRRRRSYSSGNW